MDQKNSVKKSEKQVDRKGTVESNNLYDADTLNMRQRSDLRRNLEKDK